MSQTASMHMFHMSQIYTWFDTYVPLDNRSLKRAYLKGQYNFTTLNKGEQIGTEVR